ncbi:ABC transporter substrate-binding protein [Devosia ginsengisoli]|uniref:ABC transporter substrate-binding protein n=1 Tax=Devosia ginsengisoli TaxID=400770 RepID=A0A5B8LZE3_9HYPH|nr:ABC transporter substrate-binding protein [Devosia ginsengisoli]QDZ12740.1 ABC transporter substrate-binding protein [Devosia ginsengisoli]
MIRTIATTSAVLASVLMSSSAMSAEPLKLMLNWKAGGDHAPLYYALQEGWFNEAGVDLEIIQGNGSGAAATALGVGQVDMAIIDMPTALQFRGEGSDIVGVFVAYNDSANGIYWKKSSGIENVADLAGHKLGAPASDAARQFWGPISRAMGIETDSVEWVNIQPTAKVAALQSGAIDATTHMYSVHFVYEDVFGDDLGFALLRDHGLNPYGLTYFANGKAIAEKAELVKGMVQTTQRAFAFCLATPEPCSQALSSAVSMRAEDAARELEFASKVIPGTGNTLPVGAFDGDRVAADYGLVAEAFTITAYDPATAFTNDFIDTSINYPN